MKSYSVLEIKKAKKDAIWSGSIQTLVEIAES